MTNSHLLSGLWLLVKNIDVQQGQQQETGPLAGSETSQTPKDQFYGQVQHRNARIYIAEDAVPECLW